MMIERLITSEDTGETVIFWLYDSGVTLTIKNFLFIEHSGSLWWTINGRKLLSCSKDVVWTKPIHMNMGLVFADTRVPTLKLTRICVIQVSYDFNFCIKFSDLTWLHLVPNTTCLSFNHFEAKILFIVPSLNSCSTSLPGRCAATTPA